MTYFSDAYRNGINHRGKGTFDPNYSDDLRDSSASGSLYEPNGRVIMRQDTRPKVCTRYEI